ncbi:serine-rich adhesin for platelets-like [Chelonus insularis]|uniref:serine-rich adhesin for platelets-like n=1 Tax=Chelonus insularis TaxID=460826 RepID=UPI00158EC5AA|nr:serine-rich adhesin for platelets-like [Chelonus insularis]
MWGQGNRVIIVLVSVLSGCIILYNIWESLIGVTILCLVVIYACISLLINDDLSTLTFTFQTFNRAGENIHNLAKYIYYQASVSFHHSLEFVKTFYQERIVSRMNHRRNTYQLSSESLMNSNRPSQLGFIGGSSPISKVKRLNDSKSENNSLSPKKNSRILNNTRSLDEVRLSNQKSRNEDVYGDVNSTRLSWKKRSSSYLSDDPFLRGESTMYSPEGSPWGTSISPKMKSNNQEVNIVQTVAGPLLSSTRFNIDPKVYSDVTSPGLTSRLTKYASEATNKLTHQSQYSIGQFPKVNLNCSPTPLINAKVGRTRTPVTVRIAPPETIKYSPPEKQKILSSICRSGSTQSPSVVQVLKEISLKRHASRDDMSLELIKKQKTDGIYSDEYENYDEGTQKRTRDDSSRSDEEISVENTSRPYKRTKTPCYDVLSSLSCSPSTLSSGVKRKADISRSGTPELGKHFKAVDNNRSKSSPILPRNSGDFVRITKEMCKNHSEGDFSNNSKKEEKSISPKESLKSLSPKDLNLYGDKNRVIVENSPIKYTDRLFMKAEPPNIDKLKSLIEEHGNVTRKFSGDDGEEIKKSDVVNMRQTSMKARLRSMFDAISGKSSSQIDPNVVIQAESVTPRSSLLNESISPPPNTTTINSCTSTTTINTSPISTSAVTPIIGKTKDSSTPVKHVTFQLSTPSNPIINSMSNVSTTDANINTPTLPTEVQMQKAEGTKKPEIVANNSNLMSFFTPANNKISPPAFSFASTTTNSPLSSTISTKPVNHASTIPSTISTPSNTPTIQLATTSESTNIPKTNSFTINVSQPAKSESSSFGSFGSTSQKSIVAPQSSGKFTFESKTSSPAIVSTPNLLSTTSSTSKPQFQFSSSLASTTQAASTNNLSTPTNKSGLFSGGFSNSTTSASAVSSASTFSFGTSSISVSTQPAKPPAPQAAFSFGPSKALSSEKNTSLTQNTAQTVEAKPPPPSGAPSFSFNSSLNTTSPLFGLTTSSSSISTTVSTTSSASSTTSASTSTSKPVFSFGASNASSSTPLTFGASSQPSSTWFGSTPVTTSQPLQSTMSFATTLSSGANLTSTLGTTTASIFGSMSQPSIFSTASNSPSTNPSAIQFGTPKTTESSSFGTNSATTSSNIFNGINTAVTTSTPIFSGGSNIFGQTKPPAFNTQTTSSFGTTATSTFGTSSTAFGTQPTPSSSFSTITPTTKSTPAFGTSSNVIVPSFGTSNVTPLPSFEAISTTVASFGSTNNTTTFTSPTTTTPSFGTAFSSNTATPLFGTPQNTNSTTSTFNTTTPSFGTPSTAPPAFASSTTSAPTFGTSTSSGFGGSNTAPPMFGSSSSGFSGFGSNSTNTTTPFGSTSSSTPAFGSSTTIPTFGASTSNNTGSTFAFGNTANQSQPQQSSVFNFGASGSSTSGGSGAAPFQFGASSSQTGGFNFSGGSQLSGSFNTSSQGSMFSIGSGSTAPKSRAQRSRRHQR